jgi:hypothetical protein
MARKKSHQRGGVKKTLALTSCWSIFFYISNVILMMGCEILSFLRSEVGQLFVTRIHGSYFAHLSGNMQMPSKQYSSFCRTYVRECNCELETDIWYAYTCVQSTLSRHSSWLALIKLQFTNYDELKFKEMAVYSSRLYLLPEPRFHHILVFYAKCKISV